MLDLDVSNGDIFSLTDLKLEVDDSVLKLSDVPDDGDKIYLRPLDSIAKSLEFMVDRPEDLAASTSFQINNSLDNIGKVIYLQRKNQLKTQSTSLR